MSRRNTPSLSETTCSGPIVYPEPRPLALGKSLQSKLNVFNTEVCKRLAQKADITKLEAKRIAEVVEYIENTPPMPCDKTQAMRSNNLWQRHMEDDEEFLQGLHPHVAHSEMMRRATDYLFEPTTLSRVMAAFTGVTHPLIKPAPMPERKLIKGSASQLIASLATNPSNIVYIDEAGREQMSSADWDLVIANEPCEFTFCPVTAATTTLRHVCREAISRNPACLAHYKRYSVAIGDEKFDAEIYRVAIVRALETHYDKVLQYIPWPMQQPADVIRWVEKFPEIVRYARHDFWLSAERMQLAEKLMSIAPKRGPALIMNLPCHDYLIGAPILDSMIAADPTCLRHVCAVKVFNHPAYWIAAIKHCPATYKLFPESKRSAKTEKILAMIAVRLLAENLKYVVDQSEEIIKMAVAADPLAAQYVKDPVLAAKYGAEKISGDLLGKKTTAIIEDADDNDE